MLSHKTFLKKTRRGKVIKVVREHYLRDDISCGVVDCAKCEQQENDVQVQVQPRLPRPPPASPCPDLHRAPHLVVLDTNVVLDQIDVLEESKGGVENVVVLQTVLDEVRRRSLPVYKRLKDIVADSQRRSYFVFVNEHHQETYVQREPGESANDRNDRAIRAAARWYEKHAGGGGVVLLTDDADNRRLAKEEGGISGAYSVAEYVRAIKANPMLADKLRAKGGDGGDCDGDVGANKRLLFAEHLSPSQINVGIKGKSLLRGVFYRSRTNYLEGSVNCEGLEQSVLVQGLEHQNRAIDGDHVVVELLAKSRWTAPAELILDNDSGKDPGDTLDDAKALIENAVKRDAEVQVCYALKF